MNGLQLCFKISIFIRGWIFPNTLSLHTRWMHTEMDGALRKALRACQDIKQGLIHLNCDNRFGVTSPSPKTVHVSIVLHIDLWQTMSFCDLLWEDGWEVCRSTTNFSQTTLLIFRWEEFFFVNSWISIVDVLGVSFSTTMSSVCYLVSWWCHIAEQARENSSSAPLGAAENENPSTPSLFFEWKEQSINTFCNYLLTADWKQNDASLQSQPSIWVNTGRSTRRPQQALHTGQFFYGPGRGSASDTSQTVRDDARRIQAFGTNPVKCYQ